MMFQRWRTLSISDQSLPPLLIKAHLHSEGYQIHLTDLCRIWSETLSKREINKRALNNDCSIDPTDGPEQYNILLEKINGTLEQEDKTSLRFQPGDTDQGLELELQAPLPHPLPPLNWTVNFTLQEPDELNEQLITPLFHQCHELQAQTRLLMHTLQEKDRVISKLCDRLEASGNDLSIPFPQTNGKLNRKSKRSHREQLAPFVRGLGDFDENDWRKQWEQKDRSEERLEDGVLEEVTKELKVTAGGEKMPGVRAGWWRRIGSEMISERRRLQKRVPALAERQRRMISRDRQRQPHRGSQFLPLGMESDKKRKGWRAPLHRSVRNLKRKSAVPEGPLSPPSKSMKTAQSPPSTNQPRSRLGAIGGKRDPVSSVSTNPDHATSPNFLSSAQAPAERTAISREPSAFNSATPHRASDSNTPISENEAAAPKKSAKLGTIGGRNSQGRSQATPEVAGSADNQDNTTSPRKSKIGTIGGRRKVTDADDNHDHMQEDATRSGTGISGARSPANDGEESDRARKPQRESTPPPRETSREKADRKRLELKRQLESGKNGDTQNNKTPVRFCVQYRAEQQSSGQRSQERSARCAFVDTMKQSFIVSADAQSRLYSPPPQACHFLAKLRPTTRNRSRAEKMGNCELQEREQMKSAASTHPVTEHQHQHNTASSATLATDTDTASITRSPVLQASSIASSSPQQTQASEPSTVQPDAMAGLAAFNLRGWISGSAVKPEQQKSKSAEKSDGQRTHQVPDSLRGKEPGIRGTDESWELPNSEDLIHHVAESSQSLRGHHGQHIGTCRALSYGSDDYEVINAQLENAKTGTLNVMKEHNRADGNRSDARKQESAAQRLQRVHESLANAREKQWPDKKPSKSPPKDTDFPALGIGHATPKKDLPEPGKSHTETRKLSYASVASTSTKDASNKVHSATQSGRSDERNDTSSTAAGRPSMTSDAEDDEKTVIQTSTEEATSSPCGKATPHFAQPTKSFARRAGENALRKDSVPSKAAELPPGKSTQTKELLLETDKHTAQHLSKRKSIPGSWMTAESPSKTAAAGTSPQRSRFTSMPSDVDEWQFVERSSAQDAVELDATAQEGHEQNVPKKKTSSYMLPTAAATRRAVATAGQDQAKKPGTLRINTNQASQGTIQPSPVSASAKSAASSVDSIFTEKRVVGARKSPKNPQRKDQQVLNPRVTQRTAPSSPVRMREPERQQAKVAIPKATSKIPQPRKVGHSRHREALGNASPATMPVYPLAAVPNTVAKRRTSHADILKPILDKLDSQGLLKTSCEDSAIAEDKDEREVATMPKMIHREDFPETPRKMTPELAQIALRARQGVGVRGKALPPHLRSSRQTSIAGTEADTSAVTIVTEIKADNGSKEVLRTPSSDGAVFESGPKAMPKGSWTMCRQKVGRRCHQMSSTASKGFAISAQVRVKDRTCAPQTPRRESKAVPILDKDGNTIMSNTSSNEVEAGQVLKPTLSPGKKSSW
ncbi:hypothetical protein KC341_g33 [Hortaea werneckii]|nr:hypothetical protein KC341_g33 [Hortaea werneckii]